MRLKDLEEVNRLSKKLVETRANMLAVADNRELTVTVEGAEVQLEVTFIMKRGNDADDMLRNSIIRRLHDRRRMIEEQLAKLGVDTKEVAA